MSCTQKIKVVLIEPEAFTLWANNATRLQDPFSIPWAKGFYQMQTLVALLPTTANKLLPGLGLQRIGTMIVTPGLLFKLKQFQWTAGLSHPTCSQLARRILLRTLEPCPQKALVLPAYIRWKGWFTSVKNVAANRWLLRQIETYSASPVASYSLYWECIWLL